MVTFRKRRINMKAERQEAIWNILNEREIQTQEELAEALRERGFSVTQATVSRDIREMRLIKLSRANGGYQYGIQEGNTDIGSNERMIRMLRECMLSVESSGQMIVIKTLSGSANTAAEALDSMDMPDILGSIAGDNTIFLVARAEEKASMIAERVRNLMQ
jgi:transcriptional regulator of arginine metabolism